MSGKTKQQLLAQPIISVCNPDFPTPEQDIDVFYIGQNDLAESMGLKGQRKHPKVKAAVEHTIKRIADAGKIAGMNVQDEIDATRHYIGLGLSWINVHQKQFMARGSKTFFQGIKGET